MTAPPDTRPPRYPPAGLGGTGPPEAPGRTDDARAERERFIDETVAFWEPRAGRRLTREDAREIIENVTRFFLLLAAIDRRERGAERTRRGHLAALGP